MNGALTQSEPFDSPGPDARPSPKPLSRTRLKRTGYTLTGAGLLVLAATIAAAVHGPTRFFGAAVIGVCVTAGAAAVLAGFAIMVIAANPFEDESLSAPAEQESRGR